MHLSSAMTLRITTGSDGQGTNLRLSGRIRSTDIENIREAMKGKVQRIVLDLEEVTLVDRDVVRFLGMSEQEGTQACLATISSVSRIHCTACIGWRLAEPPWEPASTQLRISARRPQLRSKSLRTCLSSALPTNLPCRVRMMLSSSSPARSALSRSRSTKLPMTFG